MVGTKKIFSVDNTRKEKLGLKIGNRVIAARLYYPAIVRDEKKIVIPRKAVGEMYDSPEILSEKKMPLVIYNHGYGSYMESNNYLCCSLAEKGYFVVSVAHPYETSEIIMPDGTKILLDESVKKRQMEPYLEGMIAGFRLKNLKGSAEKQYSAFFEFQKKYCSFLNERLLEWAADVQSVVNLLKTDYSDYIDFDRGIAITGHSFGGNLAYYMCMFYSEYVCGVNMDGGIMGYYTGQKMEKPFMQICNRSNVPFVTKSLLDTDAPVVFEIIDRITHLGFTDIKKFIKSKLLMGSMSYEQISGRIVDLHEEFFRKYYKIKEE